MQTQTALNSYNDQFYSNFTKRISAIAVSAGMKSKTTNLGVSHSHRNANSRVKFLEESSKNLSEKMN